MSKLIENAKAHPELFEEIHVVGIPNGCAFLSIPPSRVGKYWHQKLVAFKEGVDDTMSLMPVLYKKEDKLEMLHQAGRELAEHYKTL